jgi:hypothetical protein
MLCYVSLGYIIDGFRSLLYGVTSYRVELFQSLCWVGTLLYEMRTLYGIISLTAERCPIMCCNIVRSFRTVTGARPSFC